MLCNNAECRLPASIPHKEFCSSENKGFAERRLARWLHPVFKGTLPKKRNIIFGKFSKRGNCSTNSITVFITQEKVNHFTKLYGPLNKVHYFH